MKRFEVTSVLTLGLAAAGFAAPAAVGATDLDDAHLGRGVKTVRVKSLVDNRCQIWVNGSLLATVGSFGDSGILSTAPASPDRPTEILARCENAVYYKILVEVHRHCDLDIDPVGEEVRGLVVRACV